MLIPHTIFHIMSVAMNSVPVNGVYMYSLCDLCSDTEIGIS